MQNVIKKGKHCQPAKTNYKWNISPWISSTLAQFHNVPKCADNSRTVDGASVSWPELKVILWLHLHVSLLRFASLVFHSRSFPFSLSLFHYCNVKRGGKALVPAVGGSPVQLVISSPRLSTVALMPEQHATRQCQNWPHSVYICSCCY